MINRLSTPTAKTRKGTTSMIMSVAVTLARFRKQMEPTTASNTISTPRNPMVNFTSIWRGRGPGVKREGWKESGASEERWTEEGEEGRKSKEERYSGKKGMGNGDRVVSSYLEMAHQQSGKFPYMSQEESDVSKHEKVAQQDGVNIRLALPGELIFNGPLQGVGGGGGGAWDEGRGVRWGRIFLQPCVSLDGAPCLNKPKPIKASLEISTNME